MQLRSIERQTNRQWRPIPASLIVILCCLVSLNSTAEIKSTASLNKSLEKIRKDWSQGSQSSWAKEATVLLQQVNSKPAADEKPPSIKVILEKPSKPQLMAASGNGVDRGGGSGQSIRFNRFFGLIQTEKLFVMDLLEYQIATSPWSISSELDPTISTDYEWVSVCRALDLQPLSSGCVALRNKVNFIKKVMPQFESSLRQRASALIWKIVDQVQVRSDLGTNAALFSVNALKSFQIAGREGKQVQVSKAGFLSPAGKIGSLDSANQAALILHEVIYSLTFEQGDRDSQRARAITALLFRPIGSIYNLQDAWGLLTGTWEIASAYMPSKLELHWFMSSTYHEQFSGLMPKEDDALFRFPSDVSNGQLMAMFQWGQFLTRVDFHIRALGMSVNALDTYLQSQNLNHLSFREVLGFISEKIESPPLGDKAGTYQVQKLYDGLDSIRSCPGTSTEIPNEFIGAFHVDVAVESKGLLRGPFVLSKRGLLLIGAEIAPGIELPDAEYLPMIQPKYLCEEIILDRSKKSSQLIIRLKAGQRATQQYTLSMDQSGKLSFSLSWQVKNRQYIFNSGESYKSQILPISDLE